MRGELFEFRVESSFPLLVKADVGSQLRLLQFLKNLTLAVVLAPLFVCQSSPTSLQFGNQNCSIIRVPRIRRFWQAYQSWQGVWLNRWILGLDSPFRIISRKFLHLLLASSWTLLTFTTPIRLIVNASRLASILFAQARVQGEEDILPSEGQKSELISTRPFLLAYLEFEIPFMQESQLFPKTNLLLGTFKKAWDARRKGIQSVLFLGNSI